MVIDVNQEQAAQDEAHQSPTPNPQPPTVRTDCCIVGGGPGGAVLAYLLARQGIDVWLLEKHGDFDRDFRGDTIHTGIMEMLDQLGLADRLLQLPHTELHQMRLLVGAAPVTVSFDHLHTKYPYVTFMPQAAFLAFLVHEAQQYPTFHLALHADVQELIEAEGVVRGVYYRGPAGRHAVRARLTVGADGRFSRVRKLAGITPVASSPTIDVLWFRLPRQAADGEGGQGALHDGTIFVLLDRATEWQIAYVIPKGTYQAIRAAGLPALRATIAAALPQLADRVDVLTDWRQFSLLSVESSMAPQWYKPGLLLIGDAAHVISPVGGVGINYAIQDAVVAANVLTEPLRTGGLRLRHLAAVQRQREWPTRIIQAGQRLIQERVLGPAAAATGSAGLPPPLRLPWARNLLAHVLAYGVWPVHLRE